MKMALISRCDDTRWTLNFLNDNDGDVVGMLGYTFLSFLSFIWYVLGSNLDLFWRESCY